MKRLACLLLAVTSTVPANAKEIDPRSLEIIQVVLSSAISEVVRNWEITETDAELIIADRTIGCALPSSREDLERLNAASELLLAGKEAPEDAFTPRPEGRWGQSFGFQSLVSSGLSFGNLPGRVYEE